MPLDGITSNYLSDELSNMLEGARVDKIYQKNRYEILLKLRGTGKNYNLAFSCNPSSPRFHITTENITNPPVPLRFCTILRKYISGSKLISVINPDSERIFYVKFKTVNELGDFSFKTIIIEIMGRHSNIILLNEEEKIIDSAIHVDSSTSSVREVLPTRKYVRPPSQNKLAPAEALRKAEHFTFFDKNSDSRADNYITNNISGFSPQLSREICICAKINHLCRIKDMSDAEINQILSALKTYLYMIMKKQYSPSVFFKSPKHDDPYDFHIFQFSSCMHYKNTRTLNEAMDMFYLFRSSQNDFTQKKNHLMKVVSKKQELLAKKIRNQKLELKECIDANLYKKYGDLILSSLHLIKNKADSVAVMDYYSIPPDNIIIPLNPSFSGSKNAQMYYKKYSKLQSRSKVLKLMLKKEEETLKYLDSIIVSLENSENESDLIPVRHEMLKSGFIKEKTSTKVKNNSDKPSAPRKFLSSEGFEILIGRNNLQNDKLSLKTASPNDIWFHIQKEPGAHCVLRLDSKEAGDTSLIEAAQLTAWYSKSSKKNVMGSKVNIDYCFAKDVWKPKGSSPGHVLYKNFKTLHVETVLPENIKSIN